MNVVYEDVYYILYIYNIYTLLYYINSFRLNISNFSNVKYTKLSLNITQ